MSQKFDIFGLSPYSKSKSISATKITNMYLETTEEKGNVLFSMPGLDTFIDFGSPKIRGMVVVKDILYLVHRSNFIKVNPDKSYSTVGTIDTSDNRVELSSNGLQVLIATGISGYIYTIATNTLSLITDSDYVGGNTSQFNDGYFIAVKPNSMQFYTSKLYDGTVWDALDFASAESNPDDLVCCMVDRGQAIMFGDSSTEFWNNTGSVLFPYTSLGVSSEWGLGARWSIVKFDNSLAYLAKNRMGELQVVRLSGYIPTRISNTAIESIINNLTITSDATALSYLHEGHAFYQLSFPSEGITLCYDATSNVWTYLVSPELSRHIGEMSISWLGNVYISSCNSGILFKVSEDSSYENGKPIVCEVISKHLSFAGNMGTINSLQLEIQNGVGIANNNNTSTYNPQISLQVSRDNGNTWSSEQYKPMGKLGEYLSTPRWSRLGSGRSFTFKIKMMDAVPRVLIGGYIT